MNRYREMLGYTICCWTIVFIPTTWAANPSEFEVFSHPQVPGRLYVPPEATTSGEPRPLILFLHGAGETGSNNTSQVNGNIDNLLANAKAAGAFLYAPQAITRTWADETRLADVMSMVDEALANYSINEERIYVTGLSMGGGGVWNITSGYSDRFAAAVPIAAVSPNPNFAGSNLTGKPVWAFHARNDGTVPSSTTRSVVNAILSDSQAATLQYPAANDQLISLLYENDPLGLRFTEFPRGGHGIWGPVYGTPELYDWMFSKSLTVPEPIPPTAGLQVTVSNFSPRFPIGDREGIAIPSGEGFFSLGAFDLSDEQVPTVNRAVLSSSFLSFGGTSPMGVIGVEGLILANVGGPIEQQDPLLGKSIYLVAGDGSDILSSESLFIFKSNELFRGDSPSAQANVTLEVSPQTGQILLGSAGTVFANRQGGFRDGFLGAFVSIPEPGTSTLLLLALVLQWRRTR